MIKKYNSKFYSYPIEVEKENGEIIVKIYTEKKEEIIYSYYDFEEKTSYSPYIKNSILASFIGITPENMLILGFGAGSYARYFKDYLGEKINITGIEIDDSMIEIAKNYFNLNDINYFNLDYLDAIEILNKKVKNKYDTIFIDLYDNNSKIPDTLNDINVINKILNLSSKNGKIIINYSDYNENITFYKQIEDKLLKNIDYKNKLHFLSGKEDYSNVVGVYNLKSHYSSEEVILNYLEKVQNGVINYDGNLISKIFIK